MKLLFILGFYITVTGFCSCQETLPSNYDSLVKSADSLLNKGNYSEALKDYETPIIFNRLKSFLTSLQKQSRNLLCKKNSTN